jgi:hypothetical protein
VGRAVTDRRSEAQLGAAAASGGTVGILEKLKSENGKVKIGRQGLQKEKLKSKNGRKTRKIKKHALNKSNRKGQNDKAGAKDRRGV